MDLLTVLKNLDAREINVSIESDWDNGFTVAIGNQRNGIEASSISPSTNLTAPPNGFIGKPASCIRLGASFLPATFRPIR